MKKKKYRNNAISTYYLLHNKFKFQIDGKGHSEIELLLSIDIILYCIENIRNQKLNSL